MTLPTLAARLAALEAAGLTRSRRLLQSAQGARVRVDGRDYIVSYNDCCGKASCGRCLCNRNEGDGPIYRPPIANDYNWCVGSKSNIPYHCTVSRIVGVADKAG